MYEFEMWTYDGTYKDVETGTVTPYVTDDLVIMTSADARLDLSFGTIPTIVNVDTRVLAFVPSSLSLPERGIALTLFAWPNPNGTAINVDIGTRPLTIPVEIDSIGVLNTRA
jgi:hypothetical protein